MISTGCRLPEATLMRMGERGPETVDLADLTRGRRVVVFGLPGAFTTTCSTAHVPSFIRNMEKLRQKGIDEVICVSVNDPFVIGAWAATTGAEAAGITMLADADGSFTRAIGMSFDAPAAGLFGRSRRYTMVVEDGTVTRLNLEQAGGVCQISSAETLLAEL